MPIESVMPSNHLIFCHPLLLLPSVFSRMRVWFKMSRLFTSGGQSIGASASASALLMNIQSWHPVGLTGLISYCPRDSQESSPTPQFKGTNSLAFSLLYGPTLTSIKTTGKTIALTRQTFVDKVMSLLFNTLSKLVITFLPRSKRLLISWPFKLYNSMIFSVVTELCNHDHN